MYPFLLAAKGKGGEGWRLRGGGCPPPGSVPLSSEAGAAPSFPGYGLLTAAEYLDGGPRAPFAGLLSQGGLGRPRGAGSRDVAVQVNLRRDAAVQCSLGRQPLPRRARAPGAPQPARPGPGARSPPSGPRPVRFPRSVAVYSPVASRRLPAVLEGAEAAAGEQGRRAPEDGGASARPVEGAPEVPPEADSQAAPQPAPASPEQPAARAQDGGDTAAQHRASPSAQPGPERRRFQFLEQKYGYYHCKDCNIRWESAYVWCVQGTNKVYFKQFCRTCQKSYNPYRVEDITCQSCKRTRCSCPGRLRHVDPKRPHRQDLCGRCKGQRLSCDSTFSFKYII